MKDKTFIIIFLIFISNNILADTWENPKVTDYFSENGKFMIKVFPTKIPDNYDKWKTDKSKKKNKYTAKDTTIILCHAILYEIRKTDTIEIWNKKLINRVVPVTALVAND